MFDDKKHRCLKGAEKMRVYTFRLPKMVSSVARKCIQIFHREESSAPPPAKKKRKRKMPG
ncbi:stage V sporulation protein SpoVM [Edaphobacillus lindanitolerans]